jgi:hypothetical protein
MKKRSQTKKLCDNHFLLNCVLSMLFVAKVKEVEGSIVSIIGHEALKKLNVQILFIK